MFVGHFAVALLAKPAAPRLSLPLLFAATTFADILWPLFILAGVEHSAIVPGITAASPLDLSDIPYSHSLLLSVVWSLLWGAPLALARRFRDAAILAGCVFSHYVLDLVTHRPDLPLAPGSDVRWGLGLWNLLVPAVVIEATLFLVAIAVYARATRATGRMGTIGFGALMLFLGLGWLSGVFGPPPPSIQAVAISALVLLPIVFVWAWRVERARPPRARSIDGRP